MRWARTATVAVLASFCGCSSCDESGSKSLPTVSATPNRNNPVPDRVIADLVEMLPLCDIDHRGLLFDFGTDAVIGRSSNGLNLPESSRTTEHDAATWTEIHERRIGLRFVLPKATPIFVGVRAKSSGTKQLSFFLDDQPLGSVKLTPGEIRIGQTEPTTLPADAGAHELEVRLSPAPRGETFAELDWLRIGTPDDLEMTYGAPTMKDIVSEKSALLGVARRSLSLRPPSLVRCPIMVAPQARLRLSVGMLAGGKADVKGAVRVDGEEPVQLFERTVEGKEGSGWQDVDVSLDAYAGRVIELELSAPAGTLGTRALLGDPAIVVPTVSPPPTPSAQAVILVVMNGLEREGLPPYAKRAPRELDRFARLAETATVFSNHRGTSTLVTSSLATTLTGLATPQHTVTDYGARLPVTVSSVLEEAQRAGVHTAFFSGVPHSFEAYGFDRGAESRKFVSPVSGDGEDALKEAANWVAKTLEQSPQDRVFAVVHARGGHPPWTVSPKQLEVLPPADYAGDINPRRAGQQVAILRRGKNRMIADDPDTVRLRALSDVGLIEQDRLLGELIDVVGSSVPRDRSLIIVTGDTTSAYSNLYSDTLPLEEQHLALPLYVVFPDKTYAHKRVFIPTDTTDIAPTIRAAMGLPQPSDAMGRDLGQIASELAVATSDPLYAHDGTQALVRWANLSLKYEPGRNSTLCDLGLDPSCAFDRRDVFPFAVRAMSLKLSRHLQRAVIAPNVKRENAELDDDTVAALRVWGSMR